MEFYEVDNCSGIHRVRLTLQYHEYIGHVAFEIGGNCHGRSILESALSFFEDCDYEFKAVENDCEFALIDGDGEDCFSMTLFDENDNPMWISDFVSELDDLIVGAEIISYQAEEDD